MSSPRPILVYRGTLLQPSETFIQCQAESLKRFRPIYICARTTNGLRIPPACVHALCSSGSKSRMERLRFKLLGPTRLQLRALAKYHPALCHAHFAPDASEAIALSRALEVPLVVSLHGYDVTSLDSHLPWLYRLRRNLLHATAARFLCVSNFIRNQALAKGFPPEKTIVHYTGVDTDFFSSDPTIPRCPIVLFVGRLVPGKGCEYLVRAMAQVQSVRPETRLVVIGDGPQRRQLEQQAAATLQGYEFLGVQAPAVVRDWMNRAKVFSSPCFITSSSQEGFGMTFVEAQAMGLPVVSCRVGGIPEAVLDGNTGFLTPERDAHALAEKLLLLLHDQTLWARFSRAGRDHVSKNFNLTTQADALEHIYDGILSEWVSRSSGLALQAAPTPTSI